MTRKLIVTALLSLTLLAAAGIAAGFFDGDGKTVREAGWAWCGPADGC